MRHQHPVNQDHVDNAPLSVRIAEKVAAVMGSMKFIVIQTVVIILWIGVNVLGVALSWDPYPFILLNLLFSTQAAYAAPFIMLAQNQQSEKDRKTLELDYQHNMETLTYLRAIHADQHGANCTLPCGQAAKANA